MCAYIYIYIGDGLRIALQWLGHGAVKPCWSHYNVLRKNSGRAAAGYVEITCHNPTLFEKWGDAAFYDAIDLMLDARAKWVAGERGWKTRLHEMEKAFGFMPTPSGLLADVELRSHVPVQRVARYDWVHTLLADGVVTHAAWSFIRSCEAHGVATQGDLYAFLRQQWIFPAFTRGSGRALWRIFDAYGAPANEKHDTLKCNASELLGLYGLLRHFAETVVHDDSVEDERRAFLSACRSLDVILLAKRGRMSVAHAAGKLRESHSEYMALDFRIHGTQNVKPKTHWTFDIADQLEEDAATPARRPADVPVAGGAPAPDAKEEDEFIFDAFIIERLHLRVKNVACNVKKKETYERSVLSGVLNAHVHSLQDVTLQSCLLSRTRPLPGFPGAVVSDRLDVLGLKVSVDDLVIRGEQLGIVAACAKDIDDFYVIVNLLAMEATVSPHSNMWRLAAVGRAVWLATDVFLPLAWKMEGLDKILVIA